MPEEFWMHHEQDMPRLSTIARRLMSIVPSSSGTKRTFSLSKRIQGLHMAHMLPEVFEDQIIICANPEIAESSYELLETQDQ